MRKLTSKRDVRALTVLCVAAYLVSYITRKNFASVLVQYTQSENIAKSEASVITVALFVCYGLGQLFSGYLGDRISPRKILTSGLLLTSVANLVMPFLGGNVSVMAVMWGINGVAQALMWPPMVKIMTNYFTSEVYKQSVLSVSIGGTVGTVLVYALSALFVGLFSDWRPIFYFSALCGLVMAVIWNLGVGKIEKRLVSTPEADSIPIPSADKEKKKVKNGFNPFTMSPILVIMLAIVLQGMLRDGVEQWMPSYLAENYGIKTEGAILSSIILPLLTIAVLKITGVVYKKYVKDEMLLSTAIFAIGALASLLLFVIHGNFTPLAVVLVATVSSAMHGVNLILIGMIPASYEKYGNVSFISGAINLCTYIGSAIFTYGIAKVAELLSWHTTLLSWVLIALIGTLLCLATINPWKRFKAK